MSALLLHNACFIDKDVFDADVFIQQVEVFPFEWRKLMIRLI